MVVVKEQTAVAAEPRNKVELHKHVELHLKIIMIWTHFWSAALPPFWPVPHATQTVVVSWVQEEEDG